jgi:hypothetical protein
MVDDALRRGKALPGDAAAIPLLQRVRGAALLGLRRDAEAEGALLQSLAAARSREASHDVAFALRALLAAELGVGDAAQPAWKVELAQLERQLGIVG